METPITAKFVLRTTDHGMPFPVVHLHVAFPVPGDPEHRVAPIMLRSMGDGRGRLRASIPVPESLHEDRDALGITADVEGVRIVAGVVRSSLDPGQPNALGVFRDLPWRVRLECDATRFSGRRAVVGTGQIDPRHWHPDFAAPAIASLPVHEIGRYGTCSLPLRLRHDAAALPLVTLLVDGRPTETRRVTTAERTGPGEPDGQGRVGIASVEFGVRGHGPVSGAVRLARRSAQGAILVRTIGIDPPVVQPAGEDGRFAFEDLPSGVTALQFEHPAYLSERVVPKDWSRPIDVQVATPRPRITLRVVDAQTGDPIDEVFLRVFGRERFGASAGELRAPGFVESSGTDGMHTALWDAPVVAVDVERVGYRPARVVDPVQRLQAEESPLVVELERGVALDLRPRDYSRIQWRRGWILDREATSPGIATLTPKLWIEWQPDFGIPPADDRDRAQFDLVLGVNNLKRFLMIDHDFSFHMEVYVDAKLRGAIDIPADTERVHFGRFALGPLSGKRKLKLRWTNDRYVKGEFDANIRYASLRLIERLADYEAP